MNRSVLLVGLGLASQETMESVLRASVLSEGLEILSCADSRNADQILSERAPAIVICGEDMPGDGQGRAAVEFLSKVRAHSPKTIRILLLTQGAPEVLIGAVNRAEVYRFLEAPLTAVEIHEVLEGALRLVWITEAQEVVWSAAWEQKLAVERVFEHFGKVPDVARDPSVFARIAEADEQNERRPASHGPNGSMQKLSAREREIVEKLAAGHRVKDIAGVLDISTHTVRNHLKAIYRKLNVRSQLDLLSLFSRSFPRK